MSTFFKRFLRQSLGGAALEFGAVIPLLLLLGVGAVDFGRAFLTGVGVASAARAGAQYGSQSITTSADTAGMRTMAESDAGNIGSIAVTTSRFCKCPDGSTPSCSGTCPGAYPLPEVFVKVGVTKSVSMIIRYPGLRQTLTFRDSSIFRAQ
jgi:Flp pilus assembly protein TadG